MNIRPLTLRVTTAVLFIFAFPYAAHTQKLILYMDIVTKQVYAEPGENRVKLGVFQQVEEDTAAEPSKVETLSTQQATDDAVQDSEQPITTQAENTTQPIEHTAVTAADSATRSVADKKWYDRIGAKGYVQFRYARSLWEGKNDIYYWQDRSVNPKNSFLLKKARLALSGDVTDYLGVKFQADLVSTPTGSTSTHFFS